MCFSGNIQGAAAGDTGGNPAVVRRTRGGSYTAHFCWLLLQERGVAYTAMTDPVFHSRSWVSRRRFCFKIRIVFNSLSTILYAFVLIHTPGQEPNNYHLFNICLTSGSGDKWAFCCCLSEWSMANRHGLVIVCSQVEPFLQNVAGFQSQHVTWRRWGNRQRSIILLA